MIAETTRPNALFLSTATQMRHAQAAKIYAWFRQLLSVNLGRAPLTFDDVILINDYHTRFMNEWDKHGEARTKLHSLLRAADAGIAEVRREKADGITRYFLRHEAEVEGAWLPLEDESQGTQALFNRAFVLLDVLERGGVLLVDELEASLHPLLARHIVQQFNSPDTNPHNAQLIFATHDTNLLSAIPSEPLLRRDQVWLTEKDSEGASHIYPLTEFEPRESENLERGYLQGRYGAIPFLGEFLVKAK